jgi:spore coat polysaccharide biosynthesis predicted glycosyltransferase SpsG
VISGSCDLKRELEGVNNELMRFQPDVFITDIWRLPKVYFEGIRKGKSIWAAVDLLDFDQSVVDVSFNAIVCELKNEMIVEGATRLYRGPAYAMLDTRCHSLREKDRNYPDRARSVVISFGGSDPLNLTSKTMKIFTDEHYDIHLTVVLGPAFAEKEKIRRIAGSFSGRMTLLENVDFLPGIFRRSDLAITAGGGGTLYELAVTGTPAVVLSEVPHQKENAERFQENGTVQFAGNGWRIDRDLLLEAVSGLVRDRAARAEMGRRGKTLVDGLGINRIADILEREQD